MPNGSVAGKSVKDLPLPVGTMVALLIRQGKESTIPTPETVLEGGDELVCLIPTGSEESFQAALTG